MRTITRTVYNIEELEVKAQEKAIEQFQEVLVGPGWHKDIIYDAEVNSYIKITSFDIDYSLSIKLDFISTAKDSALRIISEHGEGCATYSIAKDFLAACDALDRSKQSLTAKGEFDTARDLFKFELMRIYWKALKEEWEYRTSDEAIIEYLLDNDYEFYEDGTQYVEKKTK